jgi:hypothetical protein
VIARRAMTAALLAVALLGLLLPAIANRSVLLFADSAGYYRAGTVALHTITPDHRAAPDRAPHAAADRGARETGQDGISTDRSIYYGLPLAIVHDLGGPWAVILFQSLLTLAILFLAARQFGASAVEAGAIAAVVSLGTGISFFSSAVMPDIFAGIAILSAAVLLAFWPRMSVALRAFWWLAVLYSLLVHKGHVPVLALMLGLAVLLRLRKAPWRPIGALVGAAFVALSMQAAVNVVVRHMVGKAPIATPFLLARVIGDGTVQPFLETECQRRQFALCAYRSRLPLTENEFLWLRDPDRGIYGVADAEERARISSEGGRIVIESVKRRPLDQLSATGGNVARMTMLVGATRYAQDVPQKVGSVAGWEELLSDYHASPLGRGLWSLESPSRLMLVVYILALAGLLVLAATARRTAKALPSDMSLAIVLVIGGIFANAAVFGALSSAADRYQGRVAWLALFALLMAARYRFLTTSETGSVPTR